MEFKEDLVRGSIVPIVLQLLKRKAMYGYEIVKVVNERTGGKLEWKEGTLYPALYRLEEAGHVTARWEDGASRHRGPRRRIYTLTKKGMRELANRRVGWVNFVKIVGSIVAATG